MERRFNVSEPARKVIRGTLIALGCALVCLIAAAVCRHVKTASVYRQAEIMIADGRYAQAGELLETIRDSSYRDTAGLLLLCEAYGRYEAGDSLYAYRLLERASFSHQTPERMAAIAAFRTTAKQEYEAHQKAVRERERKAEEEKIRKGVPYVGMSEYDIHKTSLGRASDEVRHNREVKNGQQLIANLYDFYEGGRRIFTARCIGGIVTEVWDHRGAAGSSAKKNTGRQPVTDHDPSVSDFTNPEDFYDWYYDDFFDYEEAEAYYYDHGGV